MTDNVNQNDIITDDVALPIVSIYDVCGTDDSAIENGKWFKGEEIWPRGAGIELKLRRFTSKASTKVRRELLTKYAKYMDSKGVFPEDIDQRLLCEQIARAIIVDWKGVIDKDGLPIEFTPENAFNLCHKIPDFRAAIVNIALDMDKFRVVEEKTVEGN